MDNNIFPIPFPAHMVFVAVAFIFFLIQFIRTKYKYELVLSMAVACTALIYVKTTKMWNYSIGLIELGLLIIALVLCITEKRSRKALAAQSGDIPEGEEADEEAAETAETADTVETAEDTEKE